MNPSTQSSAALPAARKPLSSSLLFGGALSALATALSTWWLVSPAGSPLTDPTLVIIASWLSPTAVSLLIIATGSTGAVFAVLAQAGRRSATVTAAVAALQAVVFGLGLQGGLSISLAGYLMALALPAALVLLLVQCVRRYPRLRSVAIAAALAVLAWGAATRTLAPAHLVVLAQNLATGFATNGMRIAVAAFFTITAVVWVLVAVGALRESPAVERTTAAVTRHRRLFTVIAACGPLPYALVRMTWLTPWPLAAPGSDELGPEIRLWGLLLGGAAVVGVILTIGLVRPWGERFPRWMPGRAGRRVPVAAAAVPGGIVAAILCTSAVPMLAQLTFGDAGAGLGITSTADRALAALLFPFWLWGPMLALAVWGYVGHRRNDSREVLG